MLVGQPEQPSVADSGLSGCWGYCAMRDPSSWQTVSRASASVLQPVWIWKCFAPKVTVAVAIPARVLLLAHHGLEGVWGVKAKERSVGFCPRHALPTPSKTTLALCGPESIHWLHR